MMAPESPTHSNEPPTKSETLQYVTYSAKELLYLLNEKVDKLDLKLDDVVIEHARLDSRYVSQSQFAEARKEMTNARRFAIASAIASVGALGGLLGVIAVLA